MHSYEIHIEKSNKTISLNIPKDKGKSDNEQNNKEICKSEYESPKQEVLQLNSHRQLSSKKVNNENLI